METGVLIWKTSQMCQTDSTVTGKTYGRVRGASGGRDARIVGSMSGTHNCRLYPVRSSPVLDLRNIMLGGSLLADFYRKVTVMENGTHMQREWWNEEMRTGDAVQNQLHPRGPSGGLA